MIFSYVHHIFIILFPNPFDLFWPQDSKKVSNQVLVAAARKRQQLRQEKEVRKWELYPVECFTVVCLSRQFGEFMFWFEVADLSMI